MIEIRKIEGNESQRRYQLFIDGIPVSFNKALLASYSGDDYFSLTVRDYEISNQLITHKLSELFPFEYLHLSFKLEWLEILHSLLIWRNNKGGFRLTFEFGNLHSWKKLVL